MVATLEEWQRRMEELLADASALFGDAMAEWQYQRKKKGYGVGGGLWCALCGSVRHSGWWSGLVVS